MASNINTAETTALVFVAMVEGPKAYDNFLDNTIPACKAVSMYVWSKSSTKAARMAALWLCAVVRPRSIYGCAQKVVWIVSPLSWHCQMPSVLANEITKTHMARKYHVKCALPHVTIMQLLPRAQMAVELER